MTKKPLSEFIDDGKEEKKPLSSYIVDDEPKKREAITPGKGAWVDNLVEDYIAGYPLLYLQAKYNISNGQILSHVKSRGIPLRRVAKSKSTLLKRLSHLTEEDVANIIVDYQNGVSNVAIYEKYDIHKNGLYNLLDMNNIPRKSAR